MMNVSRIGSWCIVAALLAISIAVAFNNAAAVQRGPPESVEMPAREPSQEAIAERAALDVVAPQAVPAPSLRSEL